MLGSRQWFRPALQARVRDAVRAIEEQTSAELIVACVPAAGNYRHADLGVGLFTLFSVLCVFLYHPRTFDFTLLPLELALAFVVGVVLSLALPPLRRRLVRRRTLEENAERLARAQFVALGVHETRGRTGLLVQIAVFERRISVVADVNVPAQPIEEWRVKLESAFRAGDGSRFIEALGELGPALAEHLPRRADDENELPDEVAA